MTLPNQLTIFRILLAPVFVYFLFSENHVLHQLSLAVYVVAALTDWYDGWVARKWGFVTRWGKFLDPLADKILTSAAFIAFVYMGLMEGWMIIIIVIRDFSITLLRSYAELKDKPVVTAKLAKVKTFLQMAVIYYVLLLLVFKDIKWIAASWGDLLQTLISRKIIYPLMLVITLLTLVTGVMYIIDNRKTLRELYVFNRAAESDRT
jgi:CDP-diacylglycerol--glycerol-3-phosphate 3-phosphatidyltransferase